MPIPAFEATGYLPVGRHQATEQEIKVALVDAFGTSATRGRIFERWVQHRRALLDLVPVKTQWVNGSFVTNKVDPADVDVMTVVSAQDVNALPLHRKMMLETLVLAKHTRAYWLCDSFLVAEVPPSDPRSANVQASLDYWDRLWGHDRASAPKGYLEVV